MRGEPMGVIVRLEGISRSFGGRAALKAVSATATPGRLLVIAGANGSGKSTLLKIAAGLIRPTAGKVVYEDGTEQSPPFAFSSRIGFLSPELMLYEELSPIENLTFFGRLKGVADSEAAAEALLGSVGLLDRADDPLSSFSSGMRQRVKYCFALMGEPDVLLLDEPTANLDEPGRQMVYSLIEGLRATRTIIMATNEREEVLLGDEKLLLHQ